MTTLHVNLPADLPAFRPPSPSPPSQVQLDDRKPQQGLGELYEAEYMAAVTGAVDDKVRESKRGAVGGLCEGEGHAGRLCRSLCACMVHWPALTSSSSDLSHPPAQDEEVRQSARAQFSALCAKLDALSHLHFT